jgi:hypothetical protein
VIFKYCDHYGSFDGMAKSVIPNDIMPFNVMSNNKIPNDVSIFDVNVLKIMFLL